MSINKDIINVDDNTERIANLPPEYLTALEEVVDKLNDDWRNKIVYAKYISYLCDVFEDASRKGLSVDEAIGSDRQAYADKIQEELRFMDVTPTNKNKITNYLIVLDFILYVGMTVFGLGGKNLSSAQTADFVFMSVGAIIIIACIVLKVLKVKSIKNLYLLPIIQLIFAAVIMPVLNFELYAGIAAWAFNLITDFMMVSKQKN